MHKGIIAYIAIIAILVVLLFVFTGFRSPFQNTTVPTTVSLRTTIPNSSQVFGSCITLQIRSTGYNSVIRQNCTWNGGILGLWAASGMSLYENTKITGFDKIVYANLTTRDPFTTLYDVYNLPKQNYSVVFTSGPINSSASNPFCGYSFVGLNATPTGGNTIYTNLINGDFGTGTYYAWNVTGKAFGNAPLNLTLANEEGCYPETARWAGYNGFFATTYGCGYTSQAQGNLTSSNFTTNVGFLNFQIIGSGGSRSYIEILYQNITEVKAHFNTVNLTAEENGTFTFVNATLPILTLRGKTMRVRVVANETDPVDFLAIGNFRLSSTPLQAQPGVLVNLTIR